MSVRVAIRFSLAGLLLAAGSLVLMLGSCSKEPGSEVWVIGLDGADWDQLDPMIARGELPNLAKLRQEGAAGILRSDLPMISPNPMDQHRDRQDPGRAWSHLVHDGRPRRL